MSAGVRRATDLLRRRGLLLVFSDFYDRESETLSELRRAARMGHDVMVFQVVTRAELEFPFRDDVDFRFKRIVWINQFQITLVTFCKQ